METTKYCAMSSTLYCTRKVLQYLILLLPIKLLSIRTLLKIFDAYIAPIILYGSEVWTPYINHEYSKWNTNIIEQLRWTRHLFDRHPRCHSDCSHHPYRPLARLS